MDFGKREYKDEGKVQEEREQEKGSEKGSKEDYLYMCLLCVYDNTGKGGCKWKGLQ